MSDNNEYINGFNPNPPAFGDFVPKNRDEKKKVEVIPHKSTTHEERFYHFRDHNGVLQGTVFLRKEKTTLRWYGSVAIRSEKDQPNKRIGRQVARHKYFQCGMQIPVQTPSYDDAEALFDDVYALHLSNKDKHYNYNVGE